MRISVAAATLGVLVMLASCSRSAAKSDPAGGARDASSAAASIEATPGIDSGIYGWMITGRGNAPSNPPTVECVKVLDSTGRNVVARGECSGPWRQFRVPLTPGSYVVEVGGHWESRAGAVNFVPDRKAVEVKTRQWVKLAPPRPPAPLP